MIMKSRKHLGIETGIVSENIYKTSRMVSSLMNMPIQPNKAIVGRNAFSHSSGIHQDGVLKNRENYEIIDPVDVGISESIIALTARSGRAALKHRLQNLGYKFEAEALEVIYEKFLEVADRKKEVKDEDLEMLVGNEEAFDGKAIKLEHLQIVAGKSAIPMAAVTLNIKGELFTATESGNGPVDAAFKAIRTIVRHNIRLEEFLVQAITRGSDDVGKVHIQIENRGKLYYGFAGHTDILTASVEAFINAINKIV
jgi:2-isopropylmalate synthase